MSEMLVAAAWATPKGLRVGKWLPPEQCPNATHRLISPQEMVLESDHPNPRDNIAFYYKLRAILLEKGIKFEAWWSGNKSVHCHLQFDAALSKEQRMEWIEENIPQEIRSQLDLSLICSNRHMILMEGKENPKSGKRKVCIDRFEGINHFSLKNPPKPKAQAKAQATHNAKLCLFLKWCCDNPLPDGYGRHFTVLPNIAACASDAEAARYCETQRQTGSSATLEQVRAWQKREPEFNCPQLRAYAAKLDIAICNFCGGKA